MTKNTHKQKEGEYIIIDEISPIVMPILFLIFCVAMASLNCYIERRRFGGQRFQD